jgi:sialic acid synthase SpsE
MFNKIKFNNGKEIKDYGKPYFIAEVNSSHFGDIETAKKMVQSAQESGADCVKFQSWSSETLYSKTFYEKNPIAKRFIKKFSFSEDDIKNLSKFCNTIDIDFASTPYSEDETTFLLDKCKVPFIKIASMEINNHSYLEFIAKTNSAIILSTGMSTYDEIYQAVKVIQSTGNKNLCVLHCVSVYPASPESINLNNIIELRESLKNVPVGFSDHTIGIEVPIGAVALGSSVIEKHFTLDNTKIGMDNQMASMPSDFSKMVSSCNIVNSSLGSHSRAICTEEKNQRESMRRSIVSTKFIPSGKLITKEDLAFKRPGDGIPPTDILKIIGSKTKTDIEADQTIYYSDFI